MFDYIAFRGDLGSLWVATDSACNRFLGGAIIVILNLFVVGCIPMNEDANTDEEVVGLIPRNDAPQPRCRRPPWRQHAELGRTFAPPV